MNKHTQKTLKPLLGKKIKWWKACDIDRHRGSVRVRDGVLQGFVGRNAMISGDYIWMPDIHHIEEAPETKE